MLSLKNWINEMNKLLLASLLLLVGCSDNRTPEQIAEDMAADLRVNRITAVQIQIESLLNDPDSVQYNLKAVNLDNNALCYDYRAKNGFGGYVRNYIVVTDSGDVADTRKQFKQHCPDDANYERY